MNALRADGQEAKVGDRVAKLIPLGEGEPVFTQSEPSHAPVLVTFSFHRDAVQAMGGMLRKIARILDPGREQYRRRYLRRGRRR